jgi:hypothetical protein
MFDRSTRSLAALQSSAATARTLDLHSLWARLDAAAEPAWRARPLFDNVRLNRAIILKHRLRRNEAGQFSASKGVATKVVLPLDPGDLRQGGQYFFVGQPGYDPLLHGLAGNARGGASARDVRLLQILDELPGFDPFLLREALRRDGLEASACYFQVTVPDMRRMHGFVQRELDPLVRSSLPSGADTGRHTAILAAKLLSSTVDEQMEPLRQTLRLEPGEFEEGVFCWKAFLYYKWSLERVEAELYRILDEIRRARPGGGGLNSHTRAYLAWSHRAIATAARRTVGALAADLHLYDEAYRELSHGGQPGAFRAFLLEAPKLFARLGGPMGALDYIVSFWRYRFPTQEAVGVSGDELRDILSDFIAALSRSGPAVARIAA